jgi:hypothetical protein
MRGASAIGHLPYFGYLLRVSCLWTRRAAAGRGNPQPTETTTPFRTICWNANSGLRELVSGTRSFQLSPFSGRHVVVVNVGLHLMLNFPVFVRVMPVRHFGMVVFVVMLGSQVIESSNHLVEVMSYVVVVMAVN